MAMNLGTDHPVAKKQHRCESCGGAIQPGERYVRARVVDGGEAWVWKSHDDCQAAGQILFDQGIDNDGMLICVSDMDDDYREIVATASASLALRLWPTPPTPTDVTASAERGERQRGERRDAMTPAELTARGVRVKHPYAPACDECGDTGWVYFSCGTPWRCKCQRKSRAALTTGENDD